MSIRASDWLAFHADRTPDRTAMIDQATGRVCTYAQMHERSGRLASYLRRVWGVQPGDRVAILARSSSDYFELQFACVKLGAMMLPLNWRLAEPELLFILNDAAPRGLIYDSEFAGRAKLLMAGSPAKHGLRIDPGNDLRVELRMDLRTGDAAPGPEAGADDALAYEDAIAGSPALVDMAPLVSHDTPMTIMYTSGTTGHPKGVLITHGMTFWNAVNISIPAGLSCDSVFYNVLPTFHTAGLNLYANPLVHLGGTTIIAREFDADLTLRTLSDAALGVTHFFGVPAIYLFLSQQPGFADADLSRVRTWGCGGAPMPVALLETYARRGIIVQLGFGMTETSPTVFLIDRRRALQKPDSVGKPLLHTRVRVVDESFCDVPAGTVGEVVISGPNITPGYWNRPEANASSFTVDEHGDRWLHSGDAGMMDEDGCVYIVDRYKDMYISGGENVYPAEIEQVIFQLEAVADVGVIGVPDERWGESGMAVVVVKPGHDIDEERILAHCRRALAKFKVPRQVVFIDTLPRNASGKVLKRELRARLVDDARSTARAD